MAVIRFVYVISTRGTHKHRAKRMLDGDSTYCGRLIVAGSWKKVRQSKLPLCKDCEVARV